MVWSIILSCEFVNIQAAESQRILKDLISCISYIVCRILGSAFELATHNMPKKTYNAYDMRKMVYGLYYIPYADDDIRFFRIS